MLPSTFRFYIVNNTGVTVEFSTDSANNTFTIKVEGWKFASSGAIDYHGSEDTWMASPTTDLTDGSSVVASATIDNTSDLFIGAHCNAAFTTDASPNGTIDIYMEYSTDGGTTWPSDAPDFNTEEDLEFVASIRAGTTTEDRSIPFEM